MKNWNRKERKILRENYNRIPIDQLMKLLPNRTKSSIVSQVSYLRSKGWYIKWET